MCRATIVTCDLCFIIDCNRCRRCCVGESFESRARRMYYKGNRRSNSVNDKFTV
jgi:hypothetical protein